MDKSEPALVPEWLRNAGSVAGAGSSAHHPSTHTGILIVLIFSRIFYVLLFCNKIKALV